ncbi:hypothetical protein [Methylomonas fluvii]|uniref:Uncharacterized protein n=1 Tax=Methylomonas fluvii TaxID=1854564 RepID=A0ABR9DKS6_9GAMM|nr:hypothetical protein [Methylomonas fluvii]MBD9362933.1 hypothetical protein [Methylomonas fluvii]
MSEIEYRDVTGVTVYFSQEKISELLAAMSPEQLHFSGMLANTLQHPHEIWKAMHEDEANKGQWHWVRSYVHYLDLSASDTDATFGIAVMGFAYRSRWDLETVGLLLGNEAIIMAKINKDIRSGSCEYSANRH